jgi:4'-phosphopantetheinyl transferase
MAPLQQSVAVHAWPQNMPLAVAELRASQGMTIISVATPATTNRLFARELIRTAVRETLAAFLHQPVSSITLVSRPGRGIEVDPLLAGLHVSVSHMPGMSVAAIAHGVAVGIDVMPILQDAQAMSDWESVALDYLGPAVTALLKQTAPLLRPAAFAQAWTHYEASLKCQGLALTEWRPTLARHLATCRVMALALPAHCRGAIALKQPVCVCGSHSLHGGRP